MVVVASVAASAGAKVLFCASQFLEPGVEGAVSVSSNACPCSDCVT